jgi:hypothetical protein
MDNDAEIFYLVGYQKESGKWRSADEMLDYLIISSSGESGPVHYIDEETGATWRPLEEGAEKDIDFDNAQALGSFLRGMNEAPPS